MTDRNQRVLVVDDDRDIRTNLSDILVDLGYEVDVAEDGLSALSQIERRVYDVALLDLRMPGMDGMELYRRIKRVQAGTVVMIVTAYATSETAQAAMDAGAWQVIAKPVDIAGLIPRIDEALSRPLVILVDDDEAFCQSLWDVLHHHRYRACIAHDVEDAVERLKQRSFNVALVDVRLPGCDGREVAARIRAEYAGIRTMLVTAFRTEMMPTAERTRADDVDAVCFKPLDVATFMQMLDALTQQQGA